MRLPNAPSHVFIAASTERIPAGTIKRGRVCVTGGNISAALPSLRHDAEILPAGSRKRRQREAGRLPGKVLKADYGFSIRWSNYANFNGLQTLCLLKTKGKGKVCPDWSADWENQIGRCDEVPPHFSRTKLVVFVADSN